MSGLSQSLSAYDVDCWIAGAKLVENLVITFEAVRIEYYASNRVVRCRGVHCHGTGLVRNFHFGNLQVSHCMIHIRRADSDSVVGRVNAHLVGVKDYG